MGSCEKNIINAEIGVLNDQQLNDLIKRGYVENYTSTTTKANLFDGIDGSAFDLHITQDAWELESTAKLENNQTVQDLIEKQKGRSLNLSKERLEKNRIYIIKLKERLAFDKFDGRHGLYGRASGRSSIGRLDILTRLIIDYIPKYDEVPPDYSGGLYLEVVPLSFNVFLPIGIALNQLRVFVGKPELSRLESRELTESSPLLYHQRGLPVLSDQDILRVNLKPDITNKADPNIVAYVSKGSETVNEVDLRRGKDSHDPKAFWEFEYLTSESIGLHMKTDRFYILRSCERMFLPNDIAVTCVAYTENLGELRIHYAGFAHPNFGRQRKDKIVGTPLIFEARCHSFDVTIRDKEQFARIEYYKMSKPTDAPSGYSDQELTLSNYFKNWY